MVVSGLAVASCTGQGPTSPGLSPALASGGNGAPAATALQANTGAIQLNFSVDLTVPAYPTCAVAPPSAGVLTGTGLLTVVVRIVSDGSGGSHISSTIHAHGTAVDQNGGQWVWTDTDLNNEVVGLPSGNTSSHTFTVTQHEGFKAIGPHGEQIKVIGIFHITSVDGTTVVEVDKGNSDENEACESGFVLTPLS
jgi:VCBS repeat-containing protein